MQSHTSYANGPDLGPASVTDHRGCAMLVNVAISVKFTNYLSLHVHDRCIWR